MIFQMLIISLRPFRSIFLFRSRSFEHQHFFETSFIHQVNQAITDTRSSRFIEYFHKNMVLGSSSDDKNEILEHMCENAVQNYDIPDDFFHYIMKREEIGQTSDSSDRLGWRTRTIDLSSFHEGKRRKYDQYFYRI